MKPHHTIPFYGYVIFVTAAICCGSMLCGPAFGQTTSTIKAKLENGVGLDTSIKSSVIKPLEKGINDAGKLLKPFSADEQLEKTKRLANEAAARIKTEVGKQLDIVKIPDVKVKLKKESNLDTAVKATVVKPIEQQVNGISQSLSPLSPDAQFKKSKEIAKKATAKVSDEINKQLGILKKNPVALNLALGNALRYQPESSLENPVLRSGFVNVFSVKGTVQLFGIPLSLDLSSNHRGNYSPNAFNNNLFKFDLNPKQFAGLYMSDWQRFYDLRKNLLGGQDLTEYTQGLLQKNLSNIRQSLTNPASNSVLAKYLQNPKHIEELLAMDENGIKTTLFNRLKQDSTIQKALLEQPQRLADQKTKDQAGYGALFKERLSKLSVLKDPDKLKKLKTFSEGEIKKQLKQQIPKDTVAQTKYVNVVPGVDIEQLVAYALAQKETAENGYFDILSKQLAGSGVNANNIENALSDLIATKKLPAFSVAAINSKNLESNLKDDAALGEQVNKITATITGFKEQLADRGYDMDRLLQVQQISRSGVTSANLSEAQQSLLSRLPTGKLQHFMSALSAFKLGSFSNEVPGSTQGQDLFVNGAHATFRLGYTPVTVGYGSQNDVQAGKDADYQSSVYNSPRNITYIGTKFRGGWGGPLKVSFIGSVNKQYNYDRYRLPSISSNNVAVTITKDYRMGKLGNAVLEVSKTTTLYSNNYNLGSEAVFARKAGMFDLSTDLFQSLSFSFNHNLEIKELGMSDKVYFSYSGMGYQNPGNNGFGGAQLKMGGSVKKAFYKNKLVFNLRSDLRTQPTSYTSNDQWKSLQLQLDSRYMLSKKMNVALKFTRNTTDKRIDGTVSPVYAFNKVQADANVNYKIGKNYSFSHITFGGQQLSNSYTAASNSASLFMLNYTQTLVIKKRTLTFNLFYNKELTNTQLIGNMLNTDFSCQFPLGKKITLNTGLNYLDNKGVARQAGIREAIQFASIGHFDIGSFIDLRKNLITPQYPDLYASTRAELTVTYHLSY